MTHKYSVPGLTHAPSYRSLAIAVLAISGVCAAAAPALAQWGADTTTNTIINNSSGEQVQPKVACTASGRTLVSLFDNSTGGYDVRLQSLTSSGTVEWVVGGILLADRAVSSTVDYDLTVDADGNAYVAYNDDGGVSGAAQQIIIQKISPSGQKLWGSSPSFTGAAVSTGTLFKANPKVCVLADNSVVVGWNESVSSTITRINFQQVSTGGALINTPAVVTETGHYVALSDMESVGANQFAAMWIRGSGTSAINSAKALYAQRFTLTGSDFLPTWNAGNPVIVFNTTSVQNGYFPTLTPDGTGGVVVGFYETGGSRNSLVQHVLSTGALRFAAAAPTTGITTGLIRVSGSAVYDAAADVYYTISTQTNSSSQSSYSVFAQKLSSNGSRLWGDAGLELRPVTTSQPSFTQAQLRSGGMYGFGFLATGATTGTVNGWGVNADGTIAWSSTINNTLATKARLASAVHPSGYAVVAFTNGSTGSGDVLAQNINTDGTFGNITSECGPADVNTDGIIDGNDFTAFINAFGAGESLADINTDGVIDGDDFVLFINGFGAGC